MQPYIYRQNERRLPIFMHVKKMVMYCICIAFLACNSNTNPYANNLNIEPAVLAEIDTEHYTSIQWKDSVYDFGTITRGDSIQAKYYFTNAGKTPLFIFGTHSSCGCTVTDFPKEPIMAGKSCFITVTFKSGTQTGNIDRTIVVIANTRKSKSSRLFIRGSVQPSAR